MVSIWKSFIRETVFVCILHFLIVFLSVISLRSRECRISISKIDGVKYLLLAKEFSIDVTFWLLNSYHYLHTYLKNPLLAHFKNSPFVSICFLRLYILIVWLGRRIERIWSYHAHMQTTKLLFYYAPPYYTVFRTTE